ncbi:MAG: hypothetical protein ABIS69_06020, partial [Sediminibacterium sp.]
YSMLWSETLFLFFIILYFVSIHHYFKTLSSGRLLIVSLVVALAFATRYAGITLLAAGLFLIFFNGELVTRKKIKHLFLFFFTGSSFVTLNLIRNGRAAGHITGVREEATRNLRDNLQQIGSTLSEWLPFSRGYETVTTITFVIILLFAICLLIYYLLQQQYFSSYENIVTSFFVVYALFILTIASISRFENLTSRLLSPLYIPMLLIASSWLVGWIQKRFRDKRRILLVFVLLIYAGFQYNHYQLNAEAWEGIKDAGIPGYTEDSWTQSPAVAMVKKNKSLITQPIYANANDAVYFLTGIHATALPHREIQKEVDDFLRLPFFHLIWFIDGENTDLVSLNFIKQHKKLVCMQETAGGAVYFFADSTHILAPK